MAERETVREGATGELVRALQQSLQDLGFNPGAIDGSFGPTTSAAVTGFQELHGLDVDAIVGPTTWETLDLAVKDRSVL